LARSVDRAYELFQELDVPTLGGSRIAEYRRLFNDYMAVGYDPVKMGLKRYTRLLHAVVEVDQLVLIASAARERPNAWRGRLTSLISGPAFPLEAKRETVARDTQYECFIGAAAQLGGYDVRFQEPDVMVGRDGLIVGIAAKRPRHSSTVLKNCRRASRQIREVGLGGIVALDLSLAVFADFCVNTNDPLGAKEAVARTLWRFVESRADKLRLECRDAPVVGLLLTAYAPALVYHEDKPPTLYSTKVWLAVQIARAGPENFRWFNEFVNYAHAAAFPSTEPGA
jgi:hypothetical protein